MKKVDFETAKMLLNGLTLCHGAYLSFEADLEIKSFSVNVFVDSSKEQMSCFFFVSARTLYALSKYYDLPVITVDK